MAENFLSLEWNEREFQKHIKTFVDACPEQESIILRRFALDLLTRIVSRTPVDEGRARAGWRAAGEYLGYAVPDSSASQSGDSTIEFSLEGPNQFIKFFNNVPYIIYLEYGWSKQAPLGMVRISMAEIRAGGELPAVFSQDLSKLWEDPTRRYGRQKEIFKTVGLSNEALSKAKSRSAARAATLSALRSKKR